MMTTRTILINMIIGSPAGRTMYYARTTERQDGLRERYYGTRNSVTGQADESNPPATRAVRIPM
jgi:hypothetical protein